jgi:small subunit ribosomal protein S16
MSVRIRLTRTGKKKEPHYRVVVADQRSPRDGKFIEIIGKYHPLEDPSVIEIDETRALEWLRKGAQPSESVANLLRKVGIWEKFKTATTTDATATTTDATATSSTETTTPETETAPK